MTRAPACASCAVLPPGAAERSTMVLPATSPNRRAGKAAAASCTHHWPSAKPGSIVTEPCSGVRTDPVGSVSPCRRFAHCAASDFTVRSSDGSWPIAVAILLAGGSPARAVPPAQNQGGGVGGLGLAVPDHRLSPPPPTPPPGVWRAGHFSA